MVVGAPGPTVSIPAGPPGGARNASQYGALRLQWAPSRSASGAAGPNPPDGGGRQPWTIVVSASMLRAPKNVAPTVANLSSCEAKSAGSAMQGSPNLKVADRLNPATSVIKSHVASVDRKLCVANRTEAAVVDMDLQRKS